MSDKERLEKALQYINKKNKQLKQLHTENKVLMEQNFDMNKTVSQLRKALEIVQKDLGYIKKEGGITILLNDLLTITTKALKGE